MFENPRRSRQARNFTTNVPKILDLKSSSKQIFSRKLSLGAPEITIGYTNRLCGRPVLKRVIFRVNRAGTGAIRSEDFRRHPGFKSVLFQSVCKVSFPP